MAGTDVRPFWLVVDVRSATSDRHSGLARFVIGLTQALGEALSVRSSQKETSTEHVKLLLVAKSEPPRWAIQLIQEHPQLVSYWSGGPGALTSAWEKPQYLWSSRVLRRILKWSAGRFYWIAPCNLDRPLLSGFLLPRHLRQNLVQVIHDTIPLDQPRSMSFLFRHQFSILVKRTLSKLSHVFTVSQDSAERLARLSPKRTKPVHVLPSGIEPIFGTMPRCRNSQELLSARKLFLDRVFGQSDVSPDIEGNKPTSDELDALARRKWVIGVGRAQKYKGWPLAEEAIGQLNSDLSEGVVFIRVGGDEDGQTSSSRHSTRVGHTDSNSHANRTGRVEWNAGGLELRVESLPDDLLAQLYRCSDVLVHPSQAEGFGFPPVEAALSGLPVIYRTGTAVDGHFKGHSFHPHFWQGLTSDDSAEWRNALFAVLRNKSGLDSFFEEMQLAVHPRAFVCQRGGGQDFRWARAADCLLNVVFSKPHDGPLVGDEKSL